MRRIRSVMAATASLAILVGILALLDERVRAALAPLADGDGATGELGQARATIEGTAWLIIGVVREQSMEHAALTLFAVGAMALVLFMTRT